MIGEPDSLEYGRAVNAANAKLSRDGFTVVINSCGWSGYYITTPGGDKYVLMSNNAVFSSNRHYTLHEYSRNTGLPGRMISDKKFKDLEECKLFLQKD